VGLGSKNLLISLVNLIEAIIKRVVGRELIVEVVRDHNGLTLNIVGFFSWKLKLSRPIESFRSDRVTPEVGNSSCIVDCFLQIKGFNISALNWGGLTQRRYLSNFRWLIVLMGFQLIINCCVNK
jgi:hypothetical protein